MDELTLLMQTIGDTVFTTRQAARLGVGRERLASAVRHCEVRRLARGLYALGAEHASPEQRHLELCRALLVEYPDAVLAGRSAVVALDLPVWNVPLHTALLHRPVVSQVRRSGAVVRRGAPAAGVTGTGPVTTAAAALVQLALDHGSMPAVVSADAALNRRAVTVDELALEVAGRSGHRHVQRAVAMTALVDAASESPGESRLRMTMAMVGIDVEPQFVVRDRNGGFVARADLRVRGTRVLLEFDGAVKYRDGGVDALVHEKRREDRMRALGWIVVRVSWSDLERPAQLAARVRRAVADSRIASRTA